MKKDILQLIMVACLLPALTRAQDAGASNAAEAGASQKYKRAIARIAVKNSLRDNFELEAATDITGQACARLLTEEGKGERRIIFYNEPYLESIEKTNTRWGVYFILAHEMAHHINFDPGQAGGSALNNEMMADEWAGRTLHSMGATLEQAKMWVETCSENGDANHPNRATRVASVTKGWSKVQYQVRGAFAFSDDFSDNKNAWPVAVAGCEYSSVEAGKLSVEQASVEGADGLVCTNMRDFDIDINKNFEVEVKTKWQGGAGTDRGYGLTICGDKATSSFFTFLITANGEYTYQFTRKGADYEAVIPFTLSDAVKKKGTNTIKCIKNGENISFLINGVNVATTAYDGYMTGFGFHTEGAQTIDYDDFKLTGTKKQ